MSWALVLYDWSGWNREIFLLVNEGTPAMFAVVKFYQTVVKVVWLNLSS